MKKTVGIGLVVLVAAGAGLWGTRAAAGGDSASAGADTFTAKCASCHAKDGSGSTPVGKKMGLRDLGSADVQKQTDLQLYDVIAKGKKKMPAYDTKLSAQQIKDLVATIRGMAKQ